MNNPPKLEVNDKLCNQLKEFSFCIAAVGLSIRRHFGVQRALWLGLENAPGTSSRVVRDEEGCIWGGVEITSHLLLIILHYMGIYIIQSMSAFNASKSFLFQKPKVKVIKSLHITGKYH